MKLQRREQTIIAILETHGEISVNELSRMLDCSASTLRKQIAVMEERGLLIRTYGGIRSVDRIRDESFDSKQHKSISEKRRIAARARQLIPSGCTVALGSGTSVYALSNLLDDLNGGVIYTNSVQTADYLARCAALEVHISCGIVRGHTGTIIGGEAADYFRRSCTPDIAFIGVDAIDSAGNLFNDNLAVATTERTLLMSAKKRYILCDTSKFGKGSVAGITNLRECTGLITCGSNTELAEMYAGLTEVIIA